jgi:hypothetical protein
MKSFVSWLIWMLAIYSSIKNHPEVWKDLDFWAVLSLGLGVLAVIQFKLVHDKMEAKYGRENANLKTQIDLLQRHRGK